MQTRSLSRLGALALPLSLAAGVLLAHPAHALSIDTTNSGLDQAVGCGDLGCFTVVYDDLQASGAVTGALDLNGGSLDFAIDLASATLASTAGDAGVSSLDFSDVQYTGSVAVTLDASGNNTVDFAQTASVTATITPNGAGSAIALTAHQVLVTGVCSGTPGTALNCGLIFGPMLDFNAHVGGGKRYFRHTVDVFASTVTVVPEPGTALLLGLGLLGLAARRAS